MARGFFFCLLLCLSSNALAADAPSTPAFGLDGFMTGYYRHPDPAQMPQAMDAFAASGMAVVPAQAIPTLVFFSLVFAANPDRMKDWQADIEKQDPLTRAVLQIAAFHSHEPDWVLKQPFHTGTTNDMYWAAYFASGDARYVQKLIDQLAYCDERSDPYVYAMGISALWSLSSNARQNPDVLAIMQKVQQAASGRTQALLSQALQETPQQIRDETLATLKAGKDSGSWKPVVTWQHEPKELLSVKTDAAGKPQISLDLKVVDYFLGEIGKHIANYPPKFSSENEKIEVLTVLQTVLDQLDVLDTDQQDPKLLHRVAAANAMAYNVDVPGSGQLAEATYRILLKQDPDDVEANYGYGAFLSQTGTEGKRAIPYLMKARELGVVRADYSLGFTYLTLGDKEDALKYLQLYAKEAPDQAADIQKTIDAINTGNISFIH